MRRRGLRAGWLLGIAVGLALGGPDARGASLDGAWEVAEGRLQYRVEHLMHGATGVSTTVSGWLNCRAGLYRFRLSAPVSSFLSGDGERDAHMRAAVRAGRFGEAVVEGSGRLNGDGMAAAEATVRLAGASARYERLRFRIARGWWRVRVEGAFSLSLADFAIEPPTLLGIPSEDAVRIQVELEFRAR